jgi:hypothetical protein
VISANTTQSLDESFKNRQHHRRTGIARPRRFFAGRIAALDSGFSHSAARRFRANGEYKTRGLRNQDTAVLIDGVRFRDATAITGRRDAVFVGFYFDERQSNRGFARFRFVALRHERHRRHD